MRGFTAYFADFLCPWMDCMSQRAMDGGVRRMFRDEQYVVKSQEGGATNVQGWTV